MKFNKLKHLVRYIKNELKCETCNSTYLYKNITVVITTDEEGLFNLKCHKCGVLTVAHGGLEPDRNHNTIVSKKDVNEMSDFLDSFNGDFKKLFKSSNHKKS